MLLNLTLKWFGNVYLTILLSFSWVDSCYSDNPSTTESVDILARFGRGLLRSYIINKHPIFYSKVYNGVMQSGGEDGKRKEKKTELPASIYIRDVIRIGNWRGKKCSTTAAAALCLFVIDSLTRSIPHYTEPISSRLDRCICLINIFNGVNWMDSVQKWIH